MEYVVHKRFKGKSLSGDVNIPAKTICQAFNGVIYHDNKPVCLITSENARLHFAVNDDGEGLKRGKLVREITSLLETHDDAYQERWDKIWADPACQQFKRIQSEDHWLWNLAFFHAEIFSLEHIANLIGLTIKED